MKPLRVVMQAFGPFAGEQTVDFADLKGAGFFLITGPTGAGKTTVLDAMSFALYGVTSGGPESEGGRSGASMRSDHADSALLTRVEFDFALGPDVYRIVREPEQERPKVRGEGTTTHHQTATIWRLGDSRTEGKPLATGWTKVSDEAEALLGFRSEQFRQVVMLPQGRFQKLLAADSREREQILRALFDTGHYTAIELALKDEAAGLHKAADRVKTQREEVLGQAGADSAEGLEERRARQTVEAQEAGADATRAEALRDATQTALAAGTESARKLRELDEARTAVEGLRRRAGEIAQVRCERDAAAKAVTVADVAAAAAAAQKTEKRRREAAAAAAASHAELAGAAEEAAAELAARQALTGERDAAAAEALRLESFAGAAGALAEARTAAESAQEALATRRTATATAEAAWHEAHERAAAADAEWREAQAGLLAARLTDSAPCPVCGSRDHPAPAALADDVPSQAAVDGLRAAEAAALLARDDARSALGGTEAAAAAAAALLEEREKATPPEYSDPATLAGAIAAAQKRAAEIAAALDQATAAAHDTATALATAAAGLVTADEEAARAAEDLAAARGLFAARLGEAGFADKAAWAAACREPAEAERLEAFVEQHERESIQAGERLRLAEAAAKGVAAPDLLALDAAAGAAATAARDARTAAAGLDAEAAAAGRHLARLEELAAEEAELGERYAVFGRLADVANGGNSRHLSFQRYVLGAFLDDVLVAASQRLHLMTNGRYRLERTGRRFGGKAAAGLNLDVFDAWTGVSRPVATLSGGETFLAALALALGLAEVVQAHAGGIRLETVFVDEGFGSLDDESLDHAVASLMSLKEGGRLVGIISHVGELKERIDARLEVTAGKSGSTAHFVVP